MSARRSPRVTIRRWEERSGIIFGGARLAMTRSDLHAAIEPILRGWIRAACIWRDAPVGDHRSLTVTIDMESAHPVWVRFWSEPLSPVQTELTPVWLDPSIDDRLVDERERCLEALGFRLEGHRVAPGREDHVRTAAHVSVIARRVVQVFYDAFAYRGVQPIRATLLHEGRARIAETYESLTPQEVADLFSRSGYHLEEPEEDANAKKPPVIRCRKSGTTTVVHFLDRAKPDNLYGRVRFEADMSASDARATHLPEATGRSRAASAFHTISVVHAFSGGVTLDWLRVRIREWDALLQAPQAAPSGDGGSWPPVPPPARTIH